MPEQVFNSEGLLNQLDKAYDKAQEEYVALLWDGSYQAAAEKLTLMELIELHIDKVGEI